MEAIYLNNSKDAYVRRFRRARDGSIIEDAVLSATLYDSVGTVVATVSLSYQGSGHYRGTFSAASLTSLVEGSEYRLVVTSSNYGYSKQQWYRASVRPANEA
jgi:hypothetical protein